ncbi:PD-(D/E)XK nuclease family protein [Actinoplanes sp. NEAU-H7]|uniref:PD-(D/E)XK nuclease family protein n=1 Tax=Actinoplanes flavus TaxID=2820290 RepID=A0ABS3UJZ9_9ACTN|nr:PD-(D/E)XK nuclease family protein [Actinoplanes flavus]
MAAPSGPSLSPSRAADFKTCPLLFRFRTVDKLPETPSADQVRGTLIHAVLERLFDLPAADRTPEAAAALVAPEWEKLVAQEPELASLFAAEPPVAAGPSGSPAARSAGTQTDPATDGGVSDPATDGELSNPAAGGRLSDPAAGGQSGPAAGGQLSDPAAGGQSGPAAGGQQSPAAGGGLMRDPAAVAAEADATGQAALVDVPSGAAEAARIAAFLSGARDLLAGYFAVEDPRRLEPAERESLISTMIGDELLLRGYIDRLDVSPAGDLRVVDYKTGGAPRQAFEGRALFQLKFYALVLWRTRGVVPRALRLLYLKDAEALDYSPEAGELERFERTLLALSQAIERAKRDRDFRPKPSRLCGWCSHQSLCPEFGGTPPPYPETAAITDLTSGAEPDRVATLLRDDPLG